MTTEAQVQGLGLFGQRGFTLEHPDDDRVILMHEGKLVATFYQTRTTATMLQEECAHHLIMKHGWDGCLWNEKENQTSKKK